MGSSCDQRPAALVAVDLGGLWLVAKIVERIFGVGDCRPELGLTRTVAVYDRGAELARLRVDVIEECSALLGLRELVGGKETDADACNQKQDLLHVDAP
jgi:hypothetical protein